LNHFTPTTRSPSSTPSARTIGGDHNLNTQGIAAAVAAILQPQLEAQRAEIQDLREGMQVSLEALKEDFRVKLQGLRVEYKDLQRMSDDIRAELQRMRDESKADLQQMSNNITAELQGNTEAMTRKYDELQNEMRIDFALTQVNIPAQIKGSRGDFKGFCEGTERLLKTLRDTTAEIAATRYRSAEDRDDLRSAMAKFRGYTTAVENELASMAILIHETRDGLNQATARLNNDILVRSLHDRQTSSLTSV
jgi:hypothetical protein